MSWRQQWFSQPVKDILSGSVVAMALIPEAIAFSIIAGVDPKVGLYASFCIATIIAFVGGRPAMISAATGAMALLMTDLIKDHGLQYLLATTILTGVFQFIFGVLRLGELMRFVSKAVVTGFVNALAILIFMAQLPELTHVSWQVYAMTAGGLGIIYLFPYVTKAIPSPLVCILVMTALSMYLGLNIHTVGDMGALPNSLPTFLLPDVPFNFETFSIIAPYALGLSLVGLMESMMTATICDEFTDTDSDKNMECRGQGIANIVTGFLGGMAGCGMIGQSVINVKSGGRNRLSTLTAGVFLLILVVFLNKWVAQIPMAALVSVMIMVSIGTFSWSSIRDLPKTPLTTNIVMIVTVVTVVATHNLSIGVIVGVLLSSLFFASKVARVLYVGTEVKDGVTEYKVVGQVFFASANNFVKRFDFKEAVAKVRIDVSRAHFWDQTAVSALDKVVLKLRREGAEVEVIGLNEASATLVDRFAVHDKEQDVEKLMGH